MRICLNVAPVVHRHAGLGRYAHELTTALLATDKENDYVTFYNDPAAAHVPSPLDSLPRLTTPLATKPWRLRVLFAHMIGQSQDALFPDIDIFHATDHLLPRLKRVRSVFTLHDLAFRSCPETHTRLNRWFLSTAMPRFLRSANAIIAVSQFTKAEAIRLYRVPENKITVITEGVHPRFKPAPADEVAAVRQKYRLPERAILYVGTIEPRKNLAVLLDAYALVRSRRVAGDETKLVIVGKKGWLYEPFFLHLRQLGLEGEVIFPGYVADEELPALYSAAAVFVFPSLFEGFGLPVLEAMACGTPVVCSDASSLPEVAGEAALMVSPQDTAGMAAAIQSVLSDATLRRKLAALGLAQASRFTWEEAARRTIAVYEHVYEKGNGKT